MKKLIVAVDPVGQLRSFQASTEPDPTHFALQAELAGASGIRAHLRISQRHLSEDDVSLLNRLVKTSFYLQVSPHQDILHLVNTLRPHNLILIAERRDDHNYDSPLDAVLLVNELKGLIPNIDERQTRVFLQIEPELDQIKMAAKLRVHGIVFHIRDLVAAERTALSQQHLAKLKDAIRLSNKFGLETHLSGGITLARLRELKDLPGVEAIHIGHQLVARSLQLGVMDAVRMTLASLNG